MLALYIQKHPNHTSCLNCFVDNKADDAEFFISNYTLAEFYRNITSGRKYLTYTPANAHKLIRQAIIVYFEPVSLDHSDYLQVVDTMKKLSLNGAIIYDGLIARAAEKAGCDEIVTYNVQDFQRVWPLTSANLVEP